MGGETGCWMDGQIRRLMVEQKDRQKDKLMEHWINEQKDGQIEQ